MDQICGFVFKMTINQKTLYFKDFKLFGSDLVSSPDNADNLK